MRRQPCGVAHHLGEANPLGRAGAIDGRCLGFHYGRPDIACIDATRLKWYEANMPPQRR